MEFEEAIKWEINMENKLYQNKWLSIKERVDSLNFKDNTKVKIY